MLLAEVIQAIQLLEGHKIMYNNICLGRILSIQRNKMELVTKPWNSWYKLTVHTHQQHQIMVGLTVPEQLPMR